MRGEVGESMKTANSGFMINRKNTDEYGATSPFKRFMKILKWIRIVKENAVW